MLAEESGPLAENDYKGAIGAFDDERPPEGMMLSLAEDGFRTYRDWVYVKALGCRVEGTRSSIALPRAPGSDVYFSHHTTERITNTGAFVSSGAEIEALEADIRYAPAIHTGYADNVTADVKILPSPTDERVTRHFYGRGLPKRFDVNPKMAAYIGGKNHDITLRKAEEDLQLRDDDPHYIMLGTVGSPHKVAKNVRLENRTGLPMVIAERASDCLVRTNGEVVENRGENITIRQL